MNIRRNVKMMNFIGDLGLVMLPTTFVATGVVGLEMLDRSIEKAIERKKRKKALAKKRAIIQAKIDERKRLEKLEFERKKTVIMSQIAARKEQERLEKEKRMARVKASLEANRKAKARAGKKIG